MIFWCSWILLRFYIKKIIPPSPAGAKSRSLRVALFFATLVTDCLLSLPKVRTTGANGTFFNVAKRIADVPQSLDAKSDAILSVCSGKKTQTKSEVISRMENSHNVVQQIGQKVKLTFLMILNDDTWNLLLFFFHFFELVLNMNDPQCQIVKTFAAMICVLLLAVF